MFGKLRRLGPAPPRAEVKAALRQVYLGTFALLALPGLLLGLTFARAVRLPSTLLMVLLPLALLLAVLAAWLAARGRAQEETPLAGAVRASIQLASAPAVPFLMGCALLGQPLALAALWGLALALLLGGLLLLRP